MCIHVIEYHIYFTKDRMGLLHKSHDASVPHPSHGAPFCKRNVHMRGHFSYKMMQCGICQMHWGICEMGLFAFVRRVTSSNGKIFGVTVPFKWAGNPWVTDGPLMFLCCQCEQTLEQTLDCLAIRDVMTVIWRRRNEPNDGLFTNLSLRLWETRWCFAQI